MMDSEMRIFVFEGLGGEGKAMHKFYTENQRIRPNDRHFKMLYNPNIRFKQRAYINFECVIKKIKLRNKLTEIIGNPDIYLRSKCPIEMFETLQKFAEMRKLERASMVRDFNLYPEMSLLLTLERKYGDSLNFEDLNGFRKKRVKKADTLTADRYTEYNGSQCDALTSIGRET